MASDLKARLRAIGGAPKPARPGGLIERTHQMAAEPRLLGLDPEAISRLGYSGAWPGAHRVLFLDTETTGLSGGAGTVAFMMGLGYLDGPHFCITQLMIQNYADEPAMLRRAAQLMARFDAVVTFNGNSFDLPLIESRFTMCRMRAEYRPLERLDLMHPARRLWRRRLGSCRLQMLERHILRQGRKDDLPGSEAPKRFFEYLKSGDFAPLEPVFLHNRLDVASLASLLCALEEAYKSPDSLTEAADLLSMGLLLDRRGEAAPAARCYRAAAKPAPLSTIAALRGEKHAAEANRAFSLMLRRAGEWSRAERVWLEMVRRRQLGAWPMIELAKYYEHRAGRLPDALFMTERALLSPQGCDQDALLRRRGRIFRKLEERR